MRNSSIADRDPCPYRIIEDVGGAFAFGAVGGGVWHFGKGAWQSPRGSRLAGALGNCAARSPVMGGQFAVWGGLFACCDCTLTAIRQKVRERIGGRSGGGGGRPRDVAGAEFCGTAELLVSVTKSYAILKETDDGESNAIEIFAGHRTLFSSECRLPLRKMFDITASTKTAMLQAQKLTKQSTQTTSNRTTHAGGSLEFHRGGGRHGGHPRRARRPQGHGVVGRRGRRDPGPDRGYGDMAEQLLLGASAGDGR